MTKSLILFALILLSLPLYFACKSAKKDNAKAKMPLVELETHGCRGFCPIFKMKVLNNGNVLYEGIRFVEKMGGNVFYLTPEEMAKLRGKLADVNLWQYPERFQSTVMDGPSATLTIYDGEKSHSVTGTIDRPKPLVELENMLKDFAEIRDIHVKRGVDPNTIPEERKSEVLVKLKSDINAGNWIRQFEPMKLRLVRRISSDNIWLIAYDSELIEEKDLLERLKKTEGVLEAQANMKVEDRN